MSGERTQLEDEVYAAMQRWPELDSRRTELGLIAETLGLEFEGEPRLETGVVLGAVRSLTEAGGKDQ